MATLLCLWTALLLGILYLFFSAFEIVFGAEGYGLYAQLRMPSKGRKDPRSLTLTVRCSSMQIVGLTYIPLGLGIIIASLSHPIWAG